MRAHSWFTVTVHCHYTLSMYTVNAVTVYSHCTWYTVFWHCTLVLHTVTIHCHCTLSLYTVHCTLYSPRSHRMYPHCNTQYVRHKGQDPTLALYTVTLHLLYALTVHCHCTLSLYTVTVHCHCKLGAIFFGGGGWYFEPPSLQSFNPLPPQLQPEPKEQLQPQ